MDHVVCCILPRVGSSCSCWVQHPDIIAAQLSCAIPTLLLDRVYSWECSYFSRTGTCKRWPVQKRASDKKTNSNKVRSNRRTEMYIHGKSHHAFHSSRAIELLLLLFAKDCVSWKGYCSCSLTTGMKDRASFPSSLEHLPPISRLFTQSTCCYITKKRLFMSVRGKECL